MSPRKYRIVAEIDAEVVTNPSWHTPTIGDTANINIGEHLYARAIITSVEPIMTADDVVDEIEKLMPPESYRTLPDIHEIRSLIADYRSQEKPE